MNILLSGASGLIGAALKPRLIAAGHRVIELRRQAAGLPQSQAIWQWETGHVDLSRCGRLDAVIHLAGESIAQRWTPAAKVRIRDSRVLGTRWLSESLAHLPLLPKVLVCASATGFYGNRGDEVLDEESAPGTGFLADTCREWEAAAAPALHSGIRVVHLRLGIVLTPKGGALVSMLPAFRLGLGGPFGDGKQFWSWIALEDVLQVILRSLTSENLAGPVNAVAPQAVTNREFARSLGTALSRPCFLKLPAFAVKLLLGEMGEELLLSSARVRPRKLEQSGFVFTHPELAPALLWLLAKIPRAIVIA